MFVCEYCYGKLGAETKAKVERGCVICCDVFARVNEIAESVKKRIDEYEFDTFRVGTRARGSFRAVQELLRLMGEEWDVKRDLNVELSATLMRVLGKRQSQNPDVVITFDPECLTFEFTVKPVLLYGRYLKRVRNISQTRWVCRYCGGRGCERCGYAGKKYASSVEELIAKPAIELFRADDGILHGAGREDVDARMLGSGRPFVLEIVNPRKRKLDPSYVEEYINERSKPMVEVRGLRYAESGEIARIKSEKFRKIYRAKVIFSREIDHEELKRAADFLSGTEIRQRTPKRVEHRRADKVRIRKVYGMEVLMHRGRVAVLKIDAESGLYIKELVSGDDGRTNPSLSSLLNCEAFVEKLDVLAVY